MPQRGDAAGFYPGSRNLGAFEFDISAAENIGPRIR